jgi:Undecaprenyl-phosphate glucose phosphotransferase
VRTPARRWSPRRSNQKLVLLAYSLSAAFVDAAAIVIAAMATRTALGFVPFLHVPGVRGETSFGAAVALLVLLTTAQNGGYAFSRYLSRNGQFARTFPTWNVAFLCAIALGFATKTMIDFPRGAIGVFYVLGLAAIVLGRVALVHGFAAMRKSGLGPRRRVVAVGFDYGLTALMGQTNADREGVDVVSLFALRDNEAYIADDLALATAAVRLLRPDDVCLAIPSWRTDVIESALYAFLKLPTEVHLCSDRLLDRFDDAKIVRLGALSGLTITRAPLTQLEQLEKRLFDILVASTALVLLSPFLAFVAALIPLESNGPALFRQTRYGLNQEPFRIYKFRTMTTMDDGAHVEQAKRFDARITRIGAYLRRLSIDELPQLLNVLRGEMSIVGPRPHAVSHDQRYVERLARYARRHNVKPGITGWAQVRGHRGEIANDARMQARLEHDLYYIDNWSLWLDVKIILFTIFSPRSHQNAH